MESSAGGIKTSAAFAVAERRRARLSATRTVLLLLAAVMVTCAAIDAVPIRARESQQQDRKPFFLVASPDLPDPLFQQTVILMLPPSEPPIVAGLVINKPTKVTFGQLFGHSPAIRNEAQSVYFGGPVELTSPTILMRAAQAPDATTRVFENVYMSVDTGSVRELLKRPGSEKDLRLFLGRAQWTEDQLHSEILRGAWIIAAASPELVFSPDPGSVWRVLVQWAKVREIEWGFREDPGPAGNAECTCASVLSLKIY
jgi:putative transcriptional regulator